MSRILGIGTDLHKMSRFVEIIQRNGPLNTYKTKRFSERILNPVHELPKFQNFQNENNLQECCKLLSISWCIKEAVYKTLDPVDQKNFIMKDWYKINDEIGKPIVKNDDYLKTRKETFLCSLTHDGGFVSSFILRQLN